MASNLENSYRYDCSCGMWFTGISFWTAHVAEAIAERLKEKENKVQ